MAYNPGGGQNPGGNDEMFSDGPPQGGDMEQEGDKGEVTGILPKEILMGKSFNVGDEVVLRITRIGEKDVEVSYAEDKGKEEPHPEEPAQSSAPPSSDMESMMS